ncbi:hypothetical protein G6729_03985 [Polynucleobacter paneuropaeus]|nr:hypothetical protein G6729_03985 [Polynucleobacter paneuropaeus]
MSNSIKTLLDIFNYIIQQHPEFTQNINLPGSPSVTEDLQRWAARGYSAPSPDSVKRACILRNSLPNATWVETGTYLGDTTEELAKIGKHVYSLEPDLHLYENAKNRFGSFHNVSIINSTSEDYFPKLVNILNNDACFWLDGHFSGESTYKGPNDTPIVIELNHIKDALKNLNKVVIMVDDIRLFTGEVHSYGPYPKIDYLVKWALEAGLDWHIEQDIFIAKN